MKTRHAPVSDDDDDAPPEAISLSSGKAAALERAAASRGAAGSSSARQQQRAVAERESRLIGQGLRDTLPAELLAELPPAAPLVAPQKAAAGGGGEAPAARPRKTWPAAAAAKQRRAAAAAARRSAGLGKLVREAGNVEYSLPPPPGAPRGAVSDKVRAFAAEAMMGRGRVKRAPAAGIGSLKPHGGRLGPGFAPARNFATAEADPEQSSGPSKASRRRKRRAQPVVISATPTALERRAAKLMRG